MADLLLLGKNLSTGLTEAMTKLKVDNSNGQLKSSTTTGTAPISVTSTTLVSNLTTQYLGAVNQDSAYHLNIANHSIASQANGDVLYYNSGWTRLPKGTDTQVLTLASGLPSWSNISGTLPSASVGDLLVGTSGSAWTTLGIAPTDGALLMSTGTTAAWSTAPTANGDLMYWNNTGAAYAALHTGTAYQALRVNSGATGIEYGSAMPVAGGTGADSSAWLGVPYFSAAGTWNHTTGIAAGDLFYGSAANTLSQLGIGTTGLALTSNGTAPGWGVVGASGGGTGQNTSASTGVPYISSGTWSVDASALAATHGGTAQTSYAQGDTLYASATNTLSKLTKGTSYQLYRMNVGATVPEWGLAMPIAGGTGLNTSASSGVATVATGTWSIAAQLSAALGGTGGDSSAQSGVPVLNIGTWAYNAGLNDLSDTTITAAARGDILFRGATGWENLHAGTSGYYLKTQGASNNPIWAAIPATYSWTVEDDAAVQKTLNTGEVLKFVTGGGLTTALTGSSTPYTNTISLNVDSSLRLTAGGGTDLGVNTNGIAESHIDWAATGATKIHSTNIPYDTAWLPTNIGTIGTGFPTQDTLKSITDVFAAIDTALGNIAAGLVFKGPTFSKYQFVTGSGITGTAIKQSQTVAFTVGQPANNDTFTIYDGTTTRTYTAKTSGAGANEFNIGATISATVQNLAVAIEADASKIARAQASNFPELDNTNNVLVLSAISTLTTFRTWATIAAGGGAPWTNQPTYITAFNGTSDDDTALPSVTGGTNYSAVIDQSALNEGDTYVSRSCGCWERWDNTDNEWVTIMVSPSQQYVGGDGITIDTTTEPDTIKVSLATNSGLEFNSGLRIDLTDASLVLTSNGVALNVANTNTWTVAQNFTHSSGVTTNAITEYTATNGVTVDGCKIKDGSASRSDSVVSAARIAGTGGVSLGNVVYMTATNTLLKAQANSVSTGFVYGVVRDNAAAGNPIDVYMLGGYNWSDASEISVKSQTTSGYAVGDRVYVSKVTAGTVHNDVSAFVAGDWIQCVGQVTSIAFVGGGTLMIVLNPEEPYVLA